MHLFEVAFYTAGTFYALFSEQILIFYFLLVVGGYLVLSSILPGGKDLSVRKKIMSATWTAPSEGIILNKVKVRVDKIMAFLQTLPKQNRPTLTHYVIKALGEMLKQCPDVNGKLVFGKFFQYKTEDVTCLVDIDNGKDLAMVLVEDVANKGVEDIASFIREKGSKIKKSKGDSDHKKRTGPAKFLPSFLIAILLKVTWFLHHCLGIQLKAFSIKPNMFGAACLTSVGMIGFQDAVAPFTGFTGCTFFCALNAIREQPVIEDGKVIVGKVVNINFQADHRYIDGGRCKGLIPVFTRVFEFPEEYLKAPVKKVEEKKEEIKKQN